jgi:ferritin-like metal-binding protein YciE
MVTHSKKIEAAQNLLPQYEATMQEYRVRNAMQPAVACSDSDMPAVIQAKVEETTARIAELQGLLRVDEDEALSIEFDTVMSRIRENNKLIRDFNVGPAYRCPPSVRLY